MDWIIDKLKEDSTWRGIFALLTAAGVMVKPELQTAIIAAGMGAIGLINVIRTQKQ